MNLRQLFLHRNAPTSTSPLLIEVESASGIFLHTPDGKKIMDLISGISVSNLGHRHPVVQKAIEFQLDKYWHTMVYGEFLLSPQIRFADLLTRHLPPSLETVYFVNSGAEATEGAMKLAKRATGRAEILACYRAYHGSTQGAASLMSPTTFTQPFYPLLPGIRHLHYNAPNDLEKITESTAAVILEVVQAEAGIIKGDKSYFQALRERCNQTGTLLIFDEAQTAFGRTGKLFGFESLGVIPDVLLLAKALGGGMPMGAFVASREFMGCLAENPPLGHITTFGGHPVICAAGLAALEVLLESDLIQLVSEKEALFLKLLGSHPRVKAIRSAGLMMALELGNFDLVWKAVQACLEKGLLVDWFLFNDGCLRIAPPLIIENEQIREACQIMIEALDSL